MTRIIAGAARGRRLGVPATATRPTADRAREGLFNALATMLDFDGVRVLDLYAGTGALGLEALSRGAAEVHLVEQNRAALTVLRANIAAVALPGALVQAVSVESYVGRPGDGSEPDGRGSSAAVDLVFADPPYSLPATELAALLGRLATGGRLAEDAVIVVERSARDTAWQWPAPLGAIKDRRYGEAWFWYGQQR